MSFFSFIKVAKNRQTGVYTKSVKNCFSIRGN